MRFKHYNQQQTILLPYSFDDLIPEKHPVRIVDQVVECINIQPLLKAYSKEGTPGYHPKMLLKVMLYAYMTNVISYRSDIRFPKERSTVQKNGQEGACYP